MLRSTLIFGLLLAAAPAFADATLPKVGDTLGENPVTWPKMDWLYDKPSADDAAGKVIVHWFCAPKIAACADDLSRMLELRDHGKVYVVAHINGTKADAKKFDPIRESEGVGRGTVGYGKGVTAAMKAMGVAGPASVVIDVDGKVAMVTTASSSAELDLRDKQVTTLADAIKPYAFTSAAPSIAKPDEKFTLAMSIKLASWLRYAKTRPPQFKLTAPADVKCDATTLAGDQIKVTGDMLVAQVTCSATKGAYELRGELSFGYQTLTGAQGMGQEDARWRIGVSSGLSGN